MPKQRKCSHLPFIRRHSHKALARIPYRNALDRIPAVTPRPIISIVTLLPVVAILTTCGRIVALFKNRAAPSLSCGVFRRRQATILSTSGICAPIAARRRACRPFVVPTFPDTLAKTRYFEG